MEKKTYIIDEDGKVSDKDNVVRLADLNKQERDAELNLLMQCEKLTSQGAKRDFCTEIGCEWDEYLRLYRKYKRVLEAYRREQKHANS